MVSFKPVSLICDYTENPLGLVRKTPCFSFCCEESQGEKQEAYHLIVASTKEYIDAGIGDCMDSGICKSTVNTQIPYTGKDLISRQRYFWKIKVWTKDGNESQFSDVQWFEMGLLDDRQWEAKWIGSPGFGSTAPCFRNKFVLEKKVAKARAYITGLGYYKLFVNGVGINEHMLNPAFTDVNKTVLYKVFDVSSFLSIGDNVIGVMLGCGFYNSVHFNSSHRALMFQMRLEIELEDGTKVTVISDRNNGWKVADKGPVLENGLYDGECYNSLNRIKNWNTIDLKDEDYHLYFREPIIMPPPPGKLYPELLEEIRPVQDIPYVSMYKIKDNILVYDVGQNISGYVKIRLRGDKGTTVQLSYSELLKSGNTVNKENLRLAKACDTYVVSGEEEEEYQPYFTNHGFRYVQIEINHGNAVILDLTGCWVRSACNQIGNFTCDNNMINRLHKAIVFTEGNNLQGLPVDCPQRDERLGWLNDVVVRAEEVIYNFDVTKLLTKWMYDIKDTQDPVVGAIADTAPHIRFGRYPADPVCSSYLIVPWMMYLHYGDTEILREHYTGMKKWNQYIGEQADHYIVEYSSYGDWAGPAACSVTGSAGAGAISAVTPGSLMSTGYYYYNTMLLSKIAGVLNKKEEKEYFTILAGKIKDSFHQTFFDEKKKCYATNSQGSNVFPLYLGLTGEENRKAVLTQILTDIKNHNMHFTTGNLCTKYLIEVLTQEGYVDLAYSLVTADTYPGWGYMLANGATTIWERFEYVQNGKLCEMASHNHPMYGSIGAWFYKMLAGILPSEEKPGYQEVIIKPYMPTELNHVQASIKTIKGMVESSWTKYENGYSLHVTIPYNSVGKLCFYHPQKSFDSVIIKTGNKVVWKDNKGVEGMAVEGDRITSIVLSGTHSYQYEWTN